LRLVVGFPNESAFWLAFAWTAILLMGLVATQWQPRHTHPKPAECRCVECAIRRVRPT
jgi:hypothetical protein